MCWRLYCIFFSQSIGKPFNWIEIPLCIGLSLDLDMLCLYVLQPSFVSEVGVPGRSALDSVEVAYGRQVGSLLVIPHALIIINIFWLPACG